jgi:hypothetical protein
VFGRRKKDATPSTSRPDPSDVFAGLRNQILNLDPASAGFLRDAVGNAPWGCLMETAYPNGTATLVCLRDGTTSLYTSSGFGIIGGGAHEAVVRENAALLAALEEHLSEMSSSTDLSLPREGQTVIRALTFDGQRRYEAAEEELGEGRNALSPVFHAAHGVITQLRLIDKTYR